MDQIFLMICAGLGGFFIGGIAGRKHEEFRWREKAEAYQGVRTRIESGGRLYHVITDEDYEAEKAVKRTLKRSQIQEDSEI